MIDLTVNTDGLRPTIETLAATEGQVQQALRRTLAKLGAWARSRATKSMAKELQIAQQNIRRRLRVTKVRGIGGGSAVTVWFGLNPIGIIYMNARQTARGVRARGGRDLPHAFIAKMNSTKRAVFKRRGKARLPIDIQREAIDAPGERMMTDDLAKSPEMEAQFIKIFERELRWQARKPVRW